MMSLWLPMVLALGLDDAGRSWMEAHAIPLQAVQAGSGFEDLRPLGERLAGARVVALGECTHGSREVFQLKHRLTEYLAAEQGFSVFGIEASMPDTLAVDAYVHGAELEVDEVVRGMGFWTWSTEEVAAMASWMREENRRRERPLQWWGFDLQNPQSGLEQLAILLEGDPALQQVKALQGRMSTGDFAATGLTLPGVQVAGRHLVLSGRIRTKDIEGGWAGLWVRADGAEGQVLAFDNMADRGPKGTEGWETYTIEMDIPAEAERVVFGVVQVGMGQGWYDGLELRLDGKVWTPPEAVDLDFARWEPRAVERSGQAIRGDAERWVAGGVGYTFGLDGGALRVATGGTGPLRIAEVEALAKELERRAAQDPALALPARLARTVVQGVEVAASNRRGSSVRDRAMADNVLWLLEHTDAKLVLWAHNYHVSRREGWMGAWLAEALGDAYVPLGFACGSGSYTAFDGEAGRLGAFPLTSPPEVSVEAMLGPIGRPRLLIDLREVGEDPAAAWLKRPLKMRDIGALRSEDQFGDSRVVQDYDLLVYLDQTTAAVQLPVESR